MIHTIVITYGDADPLVRDAINASVTEFFKDTDTTVLTPNATGKGVYNGTTEHSGVFVAQTIVSLRQIKKRLARIAERYDQEALGLIFQPGTDTLVLSYSVEAD